MTEPKVSRSQVVNAVRNVVFNEFAVTPDRVEAMVRDCINQRIDQLFKAQSVEAIIADSVERAIATSMKESRHSPSNIRAAVHYAVSQHVAKHLSITLNVTKDQP